MAIDNAGFADWLDRYKAAWEGRDAAAAGALFAEDATYRETPYDEPFSGRAAIEAYWAKVTSGQQDIAFTYEVIACAGDEGVAQWHCTFTATPGGETIDLDGVFRCGFATDGLVRRFEEWWHIRVTPAKG